MSCVAISHVVTELAGVHHSFGVRAGGPIESRARYRRGKPLRPAGDGHHFCERVRTDRRRFFARCDFGGSSVRGRHPGKHDCLENRPRTRVSVDDDLKQPGSGPVDMGLGLDPTAGERGRNRVGRAGRSEHDHLRTRGRHQHDGVDVDPSPRSHLGGNRHEVGLRVDRDDR